MAPIKSLSDFFCRVDNIISYVQQTLHLIHFVGEKIIIQVDPNTFRYSCQILLSERNNEFTLGAESIVYGQPTCRNMGHEYFHYLVLDHVQGTRHRQKCTAQQFSHWISVQTFSSESINIRQRNVNTFLFDINISRALLSPWRNVLLDKRRYKLEHMKKLPTDNVLLPVKVFMLKTRTMWKLSGMWSV